MSTIQSCVLNSISKVLNQILGFHKLCRREYYIIVVYIYINREITLQINNFYQCKVTSKGRVATSSAHVSEVRDVPVGINMVLT